jgi:hypothetical protein
LLLIVMGLELGVSDSFWLFERHFWLDEIYTHTLVADPSLGHAVRALAGGVETHPPGYYLALRLYTWLVGSSDEIALRMFAFLSILMALTALYATLRLTFAVGPCLAAVVVLSSHPQVVFHAFEARFYGPLLAAVSWFAYLLARSRQGKPSAIRELFLALCAIGICSVHYFGILSLLLIWSAELTMQRRLNGLRRVHWVAVGCGLLTVASSCLFLLGQRQALSVATWVETPSAQAVTSFLDQVLFVRQLAAVALIAWLAKLVGSTSPDGGLEHATGDLSLQAGLSALFAVPLLLVLFSYAVQSALVPRYAVTGVAALAPALAWLMTGIRGRWLLLMSLLAVAAGSAEMRHKADTDRAEDQYVDRMITAIRRDTGQETIVFESQVQLYVVLRYAPDFADRSCLLDFEVGELPYAPPNRVFLRDLGRRYHSFYGSPAVRPWSEIRQLPHFFFVPKHDYLLPVGKTSDQYYPGFLLRRLNRDLYDMVRAQSPTP